MNTTNIANCCCGEGRNCPTHGLSEYHAAEFVNPISYQPEMRTIQKDYIYAAIRCIQNGLDSTKELLAFHDISLGRTTRKNKMLAETYEADIKEMEQTLSHLKNS